MAQENQLSEKEQADVVKELVPAILDQVKQVSGVDIIALTKADGIESIVSSPLLFPTASALRADETPLTIKPDSLTMDLSSVDFGMGEIMQQIFSKMKVRFDSHKSYMIDGDLPIDFQFPEKMIVDMTAANMQNAATIDFATTGNAVGPIPFTQLSVNLTFGESLAGMIGLVGLESGPLITFRGTQDANGAISYSLELESALRKLLALFVKTEEGEPKVIPNFLIRLNMTGIQTTGSISASLYGVPVGASAQQIQMGDAVLYLNPSSTTTSLVVDSTIFTSYEEGVFKQYRKSVSSMAVENGDVVNTTTDSIRVSATDAWVWSKTQYVTTTSTAPRLDSKSVIPFAITRGIELISADILSTPYYITMETVMDSDGNGEMTDGDMRMTTMEIDITPSVSGLDPVATALIDIRSLNEETLQLENSMQITASLPVKGNTVVIDFSPYKEGAYVSMAKLYAETNAMGIITSNDTPAIDQANIAVTEDGIYVTNCDKGIYSIVNMRGGIVSKGRIDSMSTIIPTSSLGGGVYIFMIENNGQKEVVKFIR